MTDHTRLAAFYNSLDRRRANPFGTALSGFAPSRKRLGHSASIAFAGDNS